MNLEKAKQPSIEKLRQARNIYQKQYRQKADEIAARQKAARDRKDPAMPPVDLRGIPTKNLLDHVVNHYTKHGKFSNETVDTIATLVAREYNKRSKHRFNERDLKHDAIANVQKRLGKEPQQSSIPSPQPTAPEAPTPAAPTLEGLRSQIIEAHRKGDIKSLSTLVEQHKELRRQKELEEAIDKGDYSILGLPQEKEDLEVKTPHSTNDSHSEGFVPPPNPSEIVSANPLVRERKKKEPAPDAAVPKTPVKGSKGKRGNSGSLLDPVEQYGQSVNPPKVPAPATPKPEPAIPSSLDQESFNKLHGMEHLKLASSTYHSMPEKPPITMEESEKHLAHIIPGVTPEQRHQVFKDYITMSAPKPEKPKIQIRRRAEKSMGDIPDELDKTAATVPEGTYKLYHATHKDNIPSIQKVGLAGRTKAMGGGQKLAWLTDSPEGAFQHSVSRRGLKPEDAAVIEFTVPVPEVGLHRAIFGKGSVYSIHGGLDPKHITNITTRKMTKSTDYVMPNINFLWNRPRRPESEINGTKADFGGEC